MNDKTGHRTLGKNGFLSNLQQLEINLYMFVHVWLLVLFWTQAAYYIYQFII